MKSNCVFLFDRLERERAALISRAGVRTGVAAAVLVRVVAITVHGVGFISRHWSHRGPVGVGDW